MPLLTEFAGIGLSNYGFSRGGGGAGPAYELISTTVLSAFATSVTLTIPSGYKHIQIRTLIHNDNGNEPVRMRVNGDTGTNYASHRLQGNSSNVTSAAYLSNPFMYVTSLSVGATQPSPGIIDLLDYSSTTKYKTVRGLSGYSGVGGSMAAHLYSGL